MCGKTFSGEKYTFIIPDSCNELGHGGNGKVYNVEIINPVVQGEYVAKFFGCQEKDQSVIDKRYKRFQREAECISQYGGKGIVPILDKCCPDNLEGEFGAWYLMPKAQKYYQVYNVKTILQDMLCIADTLKELHTQGYAHRDIKPSNLMKYNGRLCLIDFGLLWHEDFERLTDEGEKVGPTAIMPYELERIDRKFDVDYTASDVYLFAKVLWIYLTRKWQGFKGPYIRNRATIYLSKPDEIRSYEPLHQLMEQTTCDEWFKRIKIQKCIELIETQLQIINYAESKDPAWKKMIDRNVYSEKTKRIIADNEPEIKEYTAEEIIELLLDAVIGCSEVQIRTLGNSEGRFVLFIGFQKNADQEYVFLEEIGRNIIQHHVKIQKVFYNTKNEEIEVLLSDIPPENIEESEVSYTEAVKKLEIIHDRTYLSKEETIFFKKR